MEYDVTIQSISWFNGRRLDQTLQISPKWQRRAVWLDKERESLIETIMLSLPFPEVYVQTIVDSATGKEEHVVVDGQQRITTILQFIDGDVSLPDTPQWGGRLFKDFGDAEKQKFWGYKIVVRTIKAVSDAEIRDLFTRLNSNTIALNEQELRNARYIGKFKQVSERLADNPFFQSIRLFTPREIRRMEDVEYVSELLLLAVEGITNKKDLLDAAYIRYDEEFPRESEFEEEFNNCIQLLTNLVTDDNATLIKTKSNFYSLFGACLQYLRTNKRKYFIDVPAAQLAITALLSATKTFDPSNAATTSDEIKEYYDAVSRASTDKQRRVRRELVLWSLLRDK